MQIRWMIRRDMPEVLSIERSCFDSAWTDEEFMCCLRQRNCIGMVCEHNDRIVGFMVYELLKSQLHILNFAVLDKRCGIGRAMIKKLIDRLSVQRRQEIVLEIRETNLRAQLFFRACGFQAHGVLRGHYEDTTEDAYSMSYRICNDIKEDITVGNRITNFLME